MRKQSVLAVFWLTVFSILGHALISYAGAQDEKTVRIGGGGSVSDVVQNYCEMYQKLAPNCAFSIVGTTTGIGFQKLIDRQLEIVMATRKITPEEASKVESKGLSIDHRYMGQIALAVITNEKNPVNELTMEQLERIFKGEVIRWSQIGGPDEPVKVTIRAVPETGAGVLFQDVVLKGRPYTQNAMAMGSYNTTVAVCGRSFAIGYIPTTTVYFNRLEERGVKILRIKKDAYAPPYQLTSGVAKESLYPISLKFYLYWDSKTQNPCVKGFVDFSEKQTQ